MAERNLLIPGTGGITLENSEGEDLGYPAKMKIGALTGGLIGRDPAELEDLLSMSHVAGKLAPEKSSLAPGISIEPGDVIDVAYNQFQNGFERFLYDWRADLRYNAVRLVDFLKSNTGANTRWNVVTHSQGGLLLILASKLMANESDFARYVRRAVLVAAPIAGTVNSAKALISGSNLGEGAAPIMRVVMRTWPALYQMMPAWKMVFRNSKAVAHEKQHFEIGGWDGHPGISEDLLLRMRDTQRKLRDPLSHMDGIRVSLLMARNRLTDLGLKRTTKITASPVARVKGDTLVPFGQTLRWLGEHVMEHVVSYPSTVNEHSMLMNDPLVAADAKRLLKESL